MRGRIHVNNDARTEDVTWMARWGETPTGAAERLGITTSGLEHWCRRTDNADLYRQLAANTKDCA